MLPWVGSAIGGRRCRGDERLNRGRLLGKSVVTGLPRKISAIGPYCDGGAAALK
jgi:hypothetical protein